MPIVFEEVTGEIAPPPGANRGESAAPARSRTEDTPLEREAALRRQLALLAERDRRHKTD